MTQSSQLSGDYFSHHPRSFLSAHTDFDEKLSAPSTPPQRGRTASRLVGYDQPILQVVPSDRPRVPRTRTLLRLLLVCTLAVLCTLGWRCESVGCAGRGGGGLVGGGSSYVGGGSVISGVDFSGILEKESWGGERQDGRQDQGSSTLDAFRHVDEEGELVGLVDGVEWDNEEAALGEVGWDESLGASEGGEEGEFDDVEQEGESVEVEGEEQQESQEKPQDEGAAVAEEGLESYEAYEATSDGVVVDTVDELPESGEGAVATVAADVDSGTQAATPVAQESRKVGEKLSSWLGSMDGLW